MIIYLEVRGRLENVKEKSEAESETSSQASKSREEETEGRLVQQTLRGTLEL
jgi:hypothetical protein